MIVWRNLYTFQLLCMFKKNAYSFGQCSGTCRTKRNIRTKVSFFCAEEKNELFK